MDAKTLCLGVLSKGPASGYEIRKEFEEGPFGHFQDVGFGSIYPALKRLVDSGLAEFAEQDRDDRPDKKMYRITAAGRQALFDQVSRDPAADKYRSDFLFVLMFSELLEPRHLDEVIARRIAFHRERVKEMQNCGSQDPQSPGHQFVHGFGKAYHEMAADYLDSKRHELIGNLLRQEMSKTAAE